MVFEGFTMYSGARMLWFSLSSCDSHWELCVCAFDIFYSNEKCWSSNFFISFSGSSDNFFIPAFFLWTCDRPLSGYDFVSRSPNDSAGDGTVFTINVGVHSFAGKLAVTSRGDRLFF